MEANKISQLLNLVILLISLVFVDPSRQVWAGHDQGQGKSQHPDHEIAVAPEPSGLLLFSVGGAVVVYRCWKKKRR